MIKWIWNNITLIAAGVWSVNWVLTGELTALLLAGMFIVLFILFEWSRSQS